MIPSITVDGIWTSPLVQVVDVMPNGVYAYMLHDYQTALYNYKPRSLFISNDKLDDTKGYPEMVPFSPRPGVKLTEKLQWFWFGQIMLSYFGHSDLSRLTAIQEDFIKNAWRGLTKGHTAFTNGAGTDTRRCFITNANPDESMPILWENSCGGTTVELYDSVKHYRLSTYWYQVKALDPAKYEIWKGWTYLDHPQYFTKATNATPYGYNGGFTRVGPWRVDPIHYLGGRDVPVPIMATGGAVYVNADRVRLLEQGEMWPRPYNP